MERKDCQEMQVIKVIQVSLAAQPSVLALDGEVVMVDWFRKDMKLAET